MLVKTWAQRGTLHLHRTDELPLWVGAQAALKPRYEQKSWLRHFKLTPEDVAAILRGVPAALRERPAHARGAGRAGARRARARLRRPAQAGRVPRRADLHAEDHVRFALPEPFEPLDPEEATREVARRYLTRYGPATREDLAKWFGHPSPAQAGTWIDGRGRDRVRAGRWRTTWRRSRPREPSGVVRLLPAFDQYVVAAPRDDARDARAGADLPPRRLVLARAARRRRDGRESGSARTTRSRSSRSRRSARRSARPPRPRPRGCRDAPASSWG